MKALGLGTGLIVLVAASALLDQETGVSIWLELRESLAVSTSRVVVLERDNETLRHEIEMLENGPTGIDRAIREELDLVLPGESIVYFTDAQTTPRNQRFYSRNRAPLEAESAPDGWADQSAANTPANTATNTTAHSAATTPPARAITAANSTGSDWMETR